MSSQGITTVELTQFQAWLQEWSSSPNILNFVDERYSLDGHIIWKEQALDLMEQIFGKLDERFDDEEVLEKVKQIEEIIKAAADDEQDDDEGKSNCKPMEISSSQKTMIGAIEEKKLERIDLPMLVNLRDQPFSNSNPHPRSQEEISMMEEYMNGNQGVNSDAMELGSDPLVRFDDYEEPEWNNDENHSSLVENVEENQNSKQDHSKTEFNTNVFQHVMDPKLFSISRGYIYEDYEMKYNYPNVYLKPNSEWAIFPYLRNTVRSYIQLPYKVICKTKNFHQVMSDEGIQLPLFYGNKEQYQHEIHTCHESEENALLYMNETVWNRVYLHTLLNISNLWNGITYTLFPWKAFSHCKESKVFDISLPFVNTSVNIARTNYYGRTFSDVYNIVYRLKQDNFTSPVYQTCGYLSSRILGACAASCSDEKGLRLHSTTNKFQIIIVPMLSKSCDTNVLYENVRSVEKKLKSLGFRVHADLRYATKNVDKFYQWESKGVSLIISIGKQELESSTITIKGRNSLSKSVISTMEVNHELISSLLEKEDVFLKDSILNRVQVIKAHSMEELISIFNEKFKMNLQSTDLKLRKKQQMEFNAKKITSSPFIHVVAPVHVSEELWDKIHEVEEEFYKKTYAEFRGYLKLEDLPKYNLHISDKFPKIEENDVCVISGKHPNAWLFTSRY